VGDARGEDVELGEGGAVDEKVALGVGAWVALAVCVGNMVGVGTVRLPMLNARQPRVKIRSRSSAE
jgi:hypothetical protein